MKKSIIFGSIYAILSIAFLAAPVVASAAESYPTGTLLKIANRPDIFYVASDGRRYQFPNMATLLTWYPHTPEIRTVEKRSDLSRVRQSRSWVTVRPGRTLVKFDDSPKVYAIENGGVLHWLETERDAIRTYGLNWQGRIAQLPATDRAAYALGSTVDAKAKFARLAITQRSTSIDQELRDRNVLVVPRTALGSTSIASIKNGGNPASLKNLRENLKGNFSPRFLPTIQSYTLIANYAEDTLILTPTAFDPSAVIRVGDMTIASGEPARIHLDYGENPIPIFVTTVTNVGKQESMNYSITVRRVEPSTDTFLTDIRENLRADFEEGFDPMEKEQALSAAYDEESVRLTPETNDKRSTITVNGVVVKNRGSLTVPLAHGDNIVPIVVMAENGASRTYTLTVNRSRFPRTEDRDLIALRENLRANLSPAFDPNYTKYWIQADKDEHRVTITATPRVKNAHVSINGDPVTSKSIFLHDEETEVVIRVEVSSTFFNEYTVVIDKSE